MIEEFNKPNPVSLRRSTKFAKPFIKLRRRKERCHKQPISEMRDDFATDYTDSKKIIGEYDEQLYVNKFLNFNKMDK